MTPNSDLRKLPAAGCAGVRRIATTRLSQMPVLRLAPSRPEGAPAGNRRAGMDLSRMLSRLPTETLSDLKPGDAVMIVASSGGGGDSLTAITMLSGVEQLLSATGTSAQPITLSPWTLGVPEGAGGGSQ